MQLKIQVFEYAPILAIIASSSIQAIKRNIS